jgi:hypothetical protein
MMKKVLLLCLVQITLFSGYSKDNNLEEMKKQEVEIVSNQTKPQKIKNMPSTIKLTKEFIIDPEKMEKLEIVTFGAFAVDDDGNIYAYDPKLVKIVVFDNKGNFKKSFGRKGNGPAELQFVTNMQMKSSELIVTDIRNRKFAFFKQDGSLIKEMKFNKRVSGGVLLENGNFLFNEMIFPSSKIKEMRSALSLYNEKVERIKELYQVEMFNPLGPKIKGIYYNLCCDISGDKIFIGGQKEEYEIYVYDFDGDLSRVIKKMYQPVVPSQEYKEMYIGMLGRFYERIKDKLYFPKHLPPFHDFLTDDEGRLYVMTYVKRKSAPEYLFDVFNPDGVFISSVFIQADLSGEGVSAKIRNNRLYVVSGGNEDSQTLVVYRLKWE